MVEKHGRHRYHRIASPQVARLLESIGQVALADQKVAKVVTGPRDEAMRTARVCYDHFAGKLGVAITDSLIKTRMIEFEDQSGVVTPKGIRHLARFGMDIAESGTKRGSRRPLCRPCLDWSVRRPHVAGVLGASICTHFIDKKYVRRQKDSRVIVITPDGDKALYEMFGIRRLTKKSRGDEAQLLVGSSNLVRALLRRSHDSAGIKTHASRFLHQIVVSKIAHLRVARQNPQETVIRRTKP